MSSARRSMASHSSDAKRRAVGVVSKQAILAVSEGNRTMMAQAAAAAVHTPPFDVPQETRRVWMEILQKNQTSASSTSGSSSSSSADATLLATLSTFLHATNIGVQYTSLHQALMLIEETLGSGGGDEKKKSKPTKGTKVETTPEATPVAPTASASVASTTPSASSTISSSLRSALFIGLFELLSLKLQHSVRQQIIHALEAIHKSDLATTSAAGAQGGDANILTTTLNSWLVRFAPSSAVSSQAASISSVIQLEQLLTWKICTEWITQHAEAVMVGATKCVEELVIARMKSETTSSTTSSAVTANQQDDTEGEDDDDSDNSASSSSASSSSSMYLSPSDQARFLLRTLVCFILRYRSCLVGLLNSPSSSTQAVKPFLHAISRILCSNSVHRDVRTQCGLILNTSIQACVSGKVNEDLTQEKKEELTAKVIRKMFFTSNDDAAASSSSTSTPAPASSDLLQRIPVLTYFSTTSFVDANIPILARLAFLRSITTHSSVGVLMKSGLEEEDKKAVGSTTLLFTCIFPYFLTSSQALLNPHLRAYCLQCCEVLLERCKEIVKEMMKTKSLDSSATLTQMDTHVLQILDLLYSNWEHPFKSIPNIVRSLFIAYVEYRNLVLQMQAVNMNADGKEKTDEVVKQKKQAYWNQFIAMMMNREQEKKSGDNAIATSSSTSTATLSSPTTSNRGLFIMLLLLLPHINVSSFLQTNPLFFKQLFAYTKVRPLFGVANALVEGVLMRTKEEMVGGVRFWEEKEKESDGDATAATNADEPAVLLSKQKRKKEQVKQRLKAKMNVGAKDDDADTKKDDNTQTGPSIAYQTAFTSWSSIFTPSLLEALCSSHIMWRSDVASGTLSWLFRTSTSGSAAFGANSMTPAGVSEKAEKDHLLKYLLKEIETYKIVSEDVTGSSVDQESDISLRRIRAIITVLRVARRLGLITSKDLDTRLRGSNGVTHTQNQLPVSKQQLLSALLHTNTDLRLEALEFLSSNLQSTEIISELEYSLFRTSLPYVIKWNSLTTRSKFIHVMMRLCVRVRDSFVREVREDGIVRGKEAAAAGKDGGITATTTSLSSSDDTSIAYPHLHTLLSSRSYALLLPTLNFHSWYLTFLWNQLYPSGSSGDRIIMALELIKGVKEVLVVEESVKKESSSITTSELAHLHTRDHIYTPSYCLILLNFLSKSPFERVRLVAYDLLRSFPTPLPGLITSADVKPVMNFLLALCRSARMKDAEGGALGVRLLVRKYVIEMKWMVKYEWKEDGVVVDGQEKKQQASTDDNYPIATSSHAALLYFLTSLHAYLRYQLHILHTTPLLTRYSSSSEHSRVHGTLLVLRSVLAEVEWNGWNTHSQEITQQWRRFTNDMLSSLREVVEISLSLHIPINASNALKNEFHSQVMAQAVNQQQMDCRGHPILASTSNASVEDGSNATASNLSASDTSLAGGDEFADSSGEQILVVSSWLAVKEVALSIGAWISSAPLPTEEDVEESTASNNSTSTTTTVIYTSPFTSHHLRSISLLFFSILSCSKHNGVLENAHQGFLAVCSTLLANGNTFQVKLVDSWLDSLMELIRNPWTGETWIRRSRGIAYCLLAILQAEPMGSKQAVNNSNEEVNDGGGEEKEEKETTTTVVATSNSSNSTTLLSRVMSELLSMARIDTESTIITPPRADMWKLKVHGLNILRAIFRDSLLALDALPYISTGLMISISGFAHQNWNVRNSSLITFGAILSKAVRTQIRTSAGGESASTSNSNNNEDETTNSNTMVSAKSGMTATDFFTQFPQLHGFLLQQLKVATESIRVDQHLSTANERASIKEESPANPADWSSDMHPSLYPILLLLSRLIPSSQAEDNTTTTTTTRLDIHSFLPFIHRCSSHPYFMARWMASKAVVSLVGGGKKLRGFLEKLVEELPVRGGSDDEEKKVNHNHIHGLLLQFHSLLSFYHTESSLLSQQEKRSLCTDLLSQLLSPQQYLWLGTNEMKCDVVRLLYLQIVELCIECVESTSSSSYSSSPSSSYRKHLLSLSVSACDSSSSSSSFTPNNSFCGIANNILRTNAVEMVVRCMLCIDPNEFQGVDLTRMILSISSTCNSLSMEEKLLWILKQAFTLSPEKLLQYINLPRLMYHILHEKLLVHVDHAAGGGGGSSAGGMGIGTNKSNYMIQQYAFQFVCAYDEWRSREENKKLTGQENKQYDLNLSTHWSSLLKFVVNSVDSSVKSSAFVCLSVCLAGELNDLLAAAGDSSQGQLRTYLHHSTIWLELLHSFADDEQPVIMRYACVKAIAASGLLREEMREKKEMELKEKFDAVPSVLPPSSTPSTLPLAHLPIIHTSLCSICLTLWCSIILTLLQDENDVVRTDCAEMVGEIVEGGDEEEEKGQMQSSSSSSATSSSPSHPHIGAGVTIVSRVFESTFKYIFSCYADELALEQYLEQMIRFYSTAAVVVDENQSTTTTAATTSLSPSPTSAATTITTSSVPFKLFEHEKANTCIEEILCIELAAHFLAAIRFNTVTAANSKVDRLSDCVQTSILNLASILGASTSSSFSSSVWLQSLGGVTYDSDTFLRVYAQLARLSSTLQPIFIKHTLTDLDFLRLTCLIDSFVLMHNSSSLHPLLQRALVRLKELSSAAASSKTISISSSLASAFLTHL